MLFSGEHPGGSGSLARASTAFARRWRRRGRCVPGACWHVASSRCGMRSQPEFGLHLLPWQGLSATLVIVLSGEDDGLIGLVLGELDRGVDDVGDEFPARLIVRVDAVPHLATGFDDRVLTGSGPVGFQLRGR